MTTYVYRDELEGFYGFLAYGSTARPLAAGGLRVQAGLTAERIEALAGTMQRKEEILQLNVDGAKCGIDYDPSAPGKGEAIRRFLRFLRPHLDDRLSLGPDMGTRFEEIEEIAREEGVGSVKAAVGRAQGLSEEDVHARLALLNEPVGPLTVGERRAGHGLAHAALAALRLTAGGKAQPTCALQGFGTLARGAALSLHEAGVRLVAIADEHGCLVSPAGLPVPELLRQAPGRRLAEIVPASASAAPREAVLTVAADLLVLAACDEALAGVGPTAIRASAVATGANRGLAPTEYDRLAERGIAVVPDIVASSGGSAAMDAIFAPAERPTPSAVLSCVARTVGVLAERVLSAPEPPWPAALRLSGEHALPAAARPYGLRVLEGRTAEADEPMAIPAES